MNRNKTVDELNYYELLTLPATAGANEIQQAYLMLMSVYSEDSPAVYGALSEKEREQMVKTIQDAFETLINENKREIYDTETLGLSAEEKEKIRAEQQQQNAVPVNGNGFNKTEIDSASSGAMGVSGNGNGEAVSNVSLNSHTISGEHLRNIRIAKGTSLEDISNYTKVRKSYLEAIESEDIQSFPAPVFMKGFLKAYAKALGLNPKEVSDKYLASG